MEFKIIIFLVDVLPFRVADVQEETNIWLGILSLSWMKY